MAHGSFDMADSGLADLITRFRETAEWIAGGGLDLQQAYADAQEQFMQGILSEEQFSDIERRIEAAALRLWRELGGV